MEKFKDGKELVIGTLARIPLTMVLAGPVATKANWISGSPFRLPLISSAPAVCLIARLTLGASGVRESVTAG